MWTSAWSDISKLRVDMDCMYQEIYEKVKATITGDACMKFCNEKETLYLETNTIGVGLGAGLLQARNSWWVLWDKEPDKYSITPYSIYKQEPH